MTYNEAKELLALSTEHQGDPTPEMAEAINMIVSQTRLNQQSQAYLSQTDWLASKYTDEVTIAGAVTDADFKLKYGDVLTARQNARDAIIK